MSIEPDLSARSLASLYLDGQRNAVQVITEGALRPVRAAMPAIGSAISISGRSASCWLCLVGSGLEALEVDPEHGAGGPGAGQAGDNPGGAREQEPNALPRADRAVDRVGVAEVVGALEHEPFERPAGQRRQLRAQLVHQAAGGVGVDLW
jgi:hypothetical protein